METEPVGAPAPTFVSDPSWPAVSLREAIEILCAPGSVFELETVSVDGVSMQVWKHQPRSLAALVQHARDKFGGTDFIVCEDERVAYEGFARAVATLAQAFLAAGVRKGDRVAIAMRNAPEWPVAFFAAVSIGAIAVPLNAWWRGAELAYALGDSGAKLLVCDRDRYDVIASHFGELTELEAVFVSHNADGALVARAWCLEDVIGAPNGYGNLAALDLPDVSLSPDDPATIFYTSGTTGRPKGALGTHRSNLICSLANTFSLQRSAVRRGEASGPTPLKPRVGLLVVPLFHVTACNSSMINLMMTGGTMVLMRKWDTLEALELIERERVQTTGGVPTVALQILAHPERHRFDLSSLEAVSYGGAPCSSDLARAIDADLSAQPGNGWGMTETAAIVTQHFGEDYLHRPDSCGPPLPLSEIKIMSEDGSYELPVGEAGELWAFGPQIVSGYWRNPEASAETFQDGWVRTGDYARVDEEGFCFIVDRKKDIIIRGGENIYSFEVENTLYDFPGVVEAALVGVAHPTLGEVPAAVVRLAPGQSASEEDVQNWVRERLAPFKSPAMVHFSDAPLPRNANGKVIKNDLRALFEGSGG